MLKSSSVRSCARTVTLVAFCAAAGTCYAPTLALAEDPPSISPFEESVARARGDYKRHRWQEKVIGGLDANWAQHKFQVALVRAQEPSDELAYFCSGALIDFDWVLTAAHCVGTKSDSPKEIAVMAGTARLGAGGQRYAVVDIFIFKGFVPEIPDDDFDRYKPPTNDIALLKLGSSIPAHVAATINVAELETPIGNETYMNVAGWGLTEANETSTVLKEISVPMVTRTVCNSVVSYNDKVTQDMLCGGEKQGGRGFCYGDSGSPATREGRVVGIVSWSYDCAKAYKYGVYTDVATFSSWISSCRADRVGCERRP